MSCGNLQKVPNCAYSSLQYFLEHGCVSLSKHQAAEYLDTESFCMGHVLESVKKYTMYFINFIIIYTIELLELNNYINMHSYLMYLTLRLSSER